MLVPDVLGQGRIRRGERRRARERSRFGECAREQPLRAFLLQPRPIYCGAHGRTWSTAPRLSVPGWERILVGVLVQTVQKQGRRLNIVVRAVHLKGWCAMTESTIKPGPGRRGIRDLN